MQQPRLDRLLRVVEERVPPDGHHHPVHPAAHVPRVRLRHRRPSEINPGRQRIRLQLERRHVQVSRRDPEHLTPPAEAFDHRSGHANRRREWQVPIQRHARHELLPIVEIWQAPPFRVQVVERSDQLVRVGVQLELLDGRHGEDAHARGGRGFAPERCVFHDEARRRVLDSEALGGEEKDGRVGFAPRDLVAGAHAAHALQQARVRRELGAEVLRGRRRGERGGYLVLTEER
mmetsp:Transcript_7412/g.33480  ORF Transcript_7412/g.33480 Transcript_7412/m.33480 type:complete len:232 (-) Transcript_7412:364-1059(-)